MLVSANGPEEAASDNRDPFLQEEAWVSESARAAMTKYHSQSGRGTLQQLGRLAV